MRAKLSIFSAKYGERIEEAMNKIATRCLNAILDNKSGSYKKEIKKLELEQEDNFAERYDCLGKLKNFFSDMKKKFTL